MSDVPVFPVPVSTLKPFRANLPMLPQASTVEYVVGAVMFKDPEGKPIAWMAIDTFLKMVEEERK